MPCCFRYRVVQMDCRLHCCIVRIFEVESICEQSHHSLHPPPFRIVYTSYMTLGKVTPNMVKHSNYFMNVITFTVKSLCAQAICLHLCIKCCLMNWVFSTKRATDVFVWQCILKCRAVWICFKPFSFVSVSSYH